jgi:hypothetical protein
VVIRLSTTLDCWKNSDVGAPTYLDGAGVARRQVIWWAGALGPRGGVLGRGAQVDGFGYAGGGYSGLLVDRRDLGGRFGLEDADRPAGAGEEESSQVADLATCLTGAAGSIGGGTLGGGVLVPR